MGGNIVKELLASSGNSLGAIGLACGDGAEGSEESGVDGTTIVEEHANDVLDPFQSCERKGSRRVKGHRLHPLPILNWDVLEGLMLGNGRMRMLVLEERLGDVVGHAEVDGAGGIIPVDGDSTEQGPVLVHHNFVVLFETLFEVDDVVARRGFDAKVVDDKTEGDVTPDVAP
jgi:hypothetical protein